MSKWVVILRFVGMGWYVGISIFLGVWIPLWLKASIPFVFLGLAIGLAVAFYGVYRMVRQLTL